MYTEHHSHAGGQSSETMPPQSGHCQFVVSLRAECLIDWIPSCAEMAGISRLFFGCGA
jgi:hypothetical protein